MKKVYKVSGIALTSVCCLAMSLSSCSNLKQDKNSEPEIVVQEINPNGSSELAILMRDMFVQTEAMQLDAEQGKLMLDEGYLENIRKFKTAIPTEDHMKPVSFDGYAEALLESALKLQRTKGEQQKEAYNELVNRCLYCHEEICPGPMVRINKLPIK